MSAMSLGCETLGPWRSKALMPRMKPLCAEIISIAMLMEQCSFWERKLVRGEIGITVEMSMEASFLNGAHQHTLSVDFQPFVVMSLYGPSAHGFFSCDMV